ncbi:MAG: hypothetical protein IID44_02865 [Planctomycetes bacterium]|nr:hypothetical protein [Planctomycetota bacterium]
MTTALALTLPQGIELDTAPSETLVAASPGWAEDVATHFGKRAIRSEEGPFSLPESLVGDVERERSFTKCIADVKGFRDLPLNWDTYGGLPAKEEPIRFSIELLNCLQSEIDISTPHVAPISSGVYVEWRNNGAILYFEVDEESVLYVMKRHGRTVAEGEDSRFSVAPAIELVERFHTLAP